MRLAQMLAEKFFLILETILSNRKTDGMPQTQSESRFVPIGTMPSPRNVGGRSQEACLETCLEEAKPHWPDLITD
jgi:hypothetical protein